MAKPSPASGKRARGEREPLRELKGKAEASKPAAKSTTRKAASAKAGDEEEAAEARPARRRKTA